MTSRQRTASLIPFFLEFVRLQALSCLFPLTVIAMLGITHLVQVPGIPRYDLMLFGCLAVQFAMIQTGLETWAEAKAISLFHVIGLALEIFKVRMGSWSYPEPGIFTVEGVPLYSGFMYASVGSYVCQSWRRLDLRLSAWPKDWQVIGITGATYANFFTHHYMPDLRWVLIALIIWTFRQVWVSFRVKATSYRMPLVASFGLIGLFIWIAENIGTRLGAWKYPYQTNGWVHVDLGKISSWSLLVIISIVLVAQLKRVKEQLLLESSTARNPIGKEMF